MTIQSSNIRFLASSVMDDTPTNGGPPSATVLSNGAEILPPASDLDYAGGRVQFRKVYLHVRTASTDTYRGANVCFTDLPENPAASVVMFRAASVGETQEDVVGRIGGVTGSLPSNYQDKISADAHVFGRHVEIGTITPDTGPAFDSYVAMTASGKYLVAIGGVAYSNVTVGGASFDVGGTPHWLNGVRFADQRSAVWVALSFDLYTALDSTLMPGTSMTLIEFSAGSTVRWEVRTVSEVLFKRYESGTYSALVVFNAAGAYPNWSASSEFYGPGTSGSYYGTAVIFEPYVSTAQAFTYYGASTTTAPITAGATSVSVAQTALPVVPASLIGMPDADVILGFDPVKLTRSGSGIEPIFERGRFVVLSNRLDQPPATYSNTDTVDFGDGIKLVKVIDANGDMIDTGYSVDYDVGLLTVNDIAGWAQPVAISGYVQELRMITDVSGLALTLGAPLEHDYPAGAVVSAALVLGDLRARVTALFDQQTWSGTWSDTVIGSPASAEFNQSTYPIELTNEGAIPMRWRIVFTSVAAFQLHGEGIGLVAVGDTGSVFEPINPVSGVPYMTIQSAAWGAGGGGWSTGNVLRINTEAAMPPFWTLRALQLGAGYGAPDTFEIAARGNI